MKNIFILLLAVVFILAGCANGKALETDAQTALPSASVSEIPSPSALQSNEAPQETKEPVVTPEPSQETKAPEPAYFTETEEVTVNEKEGQWLYSSPVLYVDVKRVSDEETEQTYYVADVRVKDAQAEIAGFANPKKPGVSGSWKPLYKIAREYSAVIAVNSDYMTKDKEKKGVIIRDSKVYNDKKAADTLAFMPDGTMKVFDGGDTTAQDLLDAGIKNTFSFGPILLSDYKLNPDLSKHPLRRKNPRTAVGMIEPYHYVLIVVDGRPPMPTNGMTLQELAEVFAKYNCSVAYNLDGGQSSTMSFMGKNINKYAGSTTGQRSVPDALMFGYSEKVSE